MLWAKKNYFGNEGGRISGSSFDIKGTALVDPKVMHGRSPARLRGFVFVDLYPRGLDNGSSSLENALNEKASSVFCLFIWVSAFTWILAY